MIMLTHNRAHDYAHATAPGFDDWNEVHACAALAGNVFNPFGYGLAFKKAPYGQEKGYYIAFSMAIQALRESRDGKILHNLKPFCMH